MIGALLMGTGGIMSMGCIIGQGLPSPRLPFRRPFTLLAIACGVRLGLEYTMTGEWRPAVRICSECKFLGIKSAIISPVTNISVARPRHSKSRLEHFRENQVQWSTTQTQSGYAFAA